MSAIAVTTVPQDALTRKRSSRNVQDEHYLCKTKRLRRSSSSDKTLVEDADLAVSNKKSASAADVQSSSKTVPAIQSALLLHAKKSPYILTKCRPTPAIKHESEILIKILVIGLNPIDWKAPDYGFGIPELPYIAGRDLVGVVVCPNMGQDDGRNPSRRVQHGDVVLSASTDYRDLRKAAYQEYAVASQFNVCRLPSKASTSTFAGLGVAFVAAALTMGVCLGCDFSILDPPVRGPNLRGILRGIQPDRIARDIRQQCSDIVRSKHQPQSDDWIAIWGGSSATALITAQLSKLLGLRVIKIVDVEKHGATLYSGFADILVDSHDPERAVSVVRGITNGRLRYAVDTVGKSTATFLRNSLASADDDQQSHLVGLTGLPKDLVPSIQHHTVPIKLHHEIEEIGEALMVWLEKLLQNKGIAPPKVEVVDGGLESINGALDRMRRAEVVGKRLVVNFDL